MPLVSADSDFVLWAIMLLTCAGAFALEKSNLGQRVSGPIIMLVTSAILSNANIVPTSALAYGTVWTYGVPVAVVLLLFTANLKKIFSESGPTFIAFSVGALGTTLGVLLGVILLGLGDAEAQLAAVFSATYIGGSLNFAAVAEAIGFQDSNLLTASLAADNVLGVLFFIVLISLPSFKFVARLFGYDPEALRSDVSGQKKPTQPETRQLLPHQADQIEDSEISSLSAARMAAALGMAFLIVAFSNWVAGIIGYEAVKLLIATAIIVAIASSFPRQMAKTPEAFPIGMLIMYLFFFMIGAGVDIATMMQSGLTIATFAAIILTTHLLVLIPVGKLLGLKLPELMVGSNACVMGPPSAAAMAGAFGWKDLVTPAILCGVFGYAIANFVALTLFASLS